MDTQPSSPNGGPGDVQPPADVDKDDKGDVPPNASQQSMDVDKDDNDATGGDKEGEKDGDKDGEKDGEKGEKKPKKKSGTRTKVKAAKGEDMIAYTTAFVPGLYNVKNPAGDFVQKESNVDIIRHQSVAKVKKEKEEIEEQRRLEKEKREQENGGPVDDLPVENPLNKILIIHPGSRFLRLGRASDFYPHEVPNCIARPAKSAGGSSPPVLGKRPAEDEWDANIGHLRDYLRNRLRANKLVTDWKEGSRVNAANARAKPENIPEHNDPYRIDWTELEGRKFVVGTEALRLPPSAGYTVRYPILRRRFNSRDWKSRQPLLDDLTTIMVESLRTELDILPKDFKNYSVVLIVPDHGDRIYVEELTNLILNVMGFKEIAVHQESYCAIFSAGMSSACVVDIGSQETSVTCVDEGMVNPDTRINLSFGGDDVTAALMALLERSSFPYKDVDLARAQDWIMLDNLKIRICTLEEHLVANTPWDFYVLSEGLTKKYNLRTYDENVLAPLCWFDTRMIDFETKTEGTASLFNPSGEVTDLIKSTYGEPTAAMKACTAHLFPSKEGDEKEPRGDGGEGTPAPRVSTPAAESDAGVSTPAPLSKTANASPNAASSATPAPAQLLGTSLLPPTATTSANATPAPEGGEGTAVEEGPSYDIPYEASKTPLDGAIAASIAQSASENKVKAAASSVLLIGGGSALKGLAPFIAERLPPLLRQRGFSIPEVQIVPPPRNLNPKFVSWKGASVMCNLESLSDMWIRPDEFEAIGARALQDRYMFL